MKKEKFFWLLTAALALVMGFVPELGSGMFAVLALPFTALGWALRRLSLTGAVGNGLALVGYAAACASPLLLWLRSKRRTEDRLLFLLPPVLAVVLYYMVNPGLRPFMLEGAAGDGVYAAAVWSILMTWAVLKLLYSREWSLERNIYRGLRWFLLLCAAGCVISCFGTGTARLLYLLRQNRENLGRVFTGADIAFMALSYLVAAAEKGLAALVLHRGAKLLRELERSPFSEESVAAANGVSALCRSCLAILCLLCLFLNLTQVLAANLLHNVSVSVSVPLLGLAVCFVMLAVTKLLVRGKELKDDNDLFV